MSRSATTRGAAVPSYKSGAAAGQQRPELRMTDARTPHTPQLGQQPNVAADLLKLEAGSRKQEAPALLTHERAQKLNFSNATKGCCQQ